MEGVTAYSPKCHLRSGRGDFILFDKILVSAILFPKRRFQTFPYTSLLEKLILKAQNPQNTTGIRGASPGIPYKL